MVDYWNLSNGTVSPEEEKASGASSALALARILRERSGKKVESRAGGNLDFLAELAWRDYILFEVDQGNVNERSNLAAIKADFMANISDK